MSKLAVNPEEKKKSRSLSIPDVMWTDLEWVAVEKRGFIKKTGKPNVSRFVVHLIAKELNKHFPSKYKLEGMKIVRK